MGDGPSFHDKPRQPIADKISGKIQDEDWVSKTFTRRTAVLGGASTAVGIGLERVLTHHNHKEDKTPEAERIIPSIVNPDIILDLIDQGKVNAAVLSQLHQVAISPTDEVSSLETGAIHPYKGQFVFPEDGGSIIMRQGHKVLGDLNQVLISREDSAKMSNDQGEMLFALVKGGQYTPADYRRNFGQQPGIDANELNFGIWAVQLGLTENNNGWYDLALMGEHQKPLKHADDPLDANKPLFVSLNQVDLDLKSAVNIT